MVESPGCSETKFGDIVYFALPSPDASSSDPRVWTSSLEQQPNFQLTPQSLVADPLLALFVLEPCKGKIGDTVQSGSEVKLLHFLTNTYVSAEENRWAFGMIFSAEDGMKIRLMEHTQRERVEEGLLSGDFVSISTLSSPSFSLSPNFWFVPDRPTPFLIHLYESYSLPSSTLGFGHPVRILSENLYLSALPNPFLSSEFVVDPESQREDYLSLPSSQRFPEYSGKLKAELISDPSNANNYWVIERKDRFVGGEVHLGEGVRVRHVASGRYLGEDMQLVEAAEAGVWVFPKTGKDLLAYSEPTALGDESGRMVLLKPSNSLRHIHTHLYCEVVKQCLRVQLYAPKQAICGVTDNLKFTVEETPVSMQRILIAFSQYNRTLPELRSMLQHCSKVSEFGEKLSALDRKISVKSLNMGTIEWEYAANVVSEGQVVNELMRIWLLAEVLRMNGEKGVEGVKVFEKVKERLQNLFFFPSVCCEIFTHRELLLKMAHHAYTPLADILQWALKSHPPSTADRVFWTELYLSAPFPRITYEDMTVASFMCHSLMDGLKWRMTLKELSWVKKDGEFVLRFETKEDALVGITCGVERTLTYLITEVCEFVATTIELAADLCLHSLHKSDIVAGMGLDSVASLYLFKSANNSLRLQMAVAYFIAIVHVPDCCSWPTATNLSTSELLELDAFDTTDPAQRESSLLYFTEANSPLAVLVPYCLSFWLDSNCTLSNEDPVTWYYNTATLIRLAAKMIDYRTVGDGFVAAMVLVGIASASGVVGREVTGFAETVPSMKESKFRNETEKQRFVDAVLELLTVYQNWKLVKVVARVIKDEGSKAAVYSACDYYQLTAMLHRSDFSGHAFAAVVTQLLDNPDVTIPGLISHLKSIDFRSRDSVLSDILERESKFSDWVCRYLSTLCGKAPFISYTMYLTPIETKTLSLIDLHNELCEQMNNFVELLTALKAMCEFILCLKESSLQNFQQFLRKSHFDRSLVCLWTYCDTLERSEEPLATELKSVVFELTRKYAENNVEIAAEIAVLLSDFPLFLDFSQYIALLKTVGLLKEGSELVAAMAVQICKKSAGSESQKHSLVALAALLDSPQTTSLCVFRLINDCFLACSNPALSKMEWEVLILLAQRVPAGLRKRVFKTVLKKWYQADENQIRREGAAVLIYTANTTKTMFRGALNATVSHLAQLNTRPNALISDRLRLLRSSQSSEPPHDDLSYILELFFAKDVGVIAQVPEWMPRITLQNLMSELAKLYLKLDLEVVTCDEVGSLFDMIKKYQEETDDPLDDLSLKSIASAIEKGGPKFSEVDSIPIEIHIEDLKCLLDIKEDS